MMLLLRTLKLCFVAFSLAVFGPQAAAAQSCTTPDGNLGDVIYNSSYDTFQGCTSAYGWTALHQPGCSAGDGCPPGPTNCDTIGDTCDDGSIYAGDSPDGGVAMYTTAADAASGYSWNDGSSNWVDTAMVNCTDVSPGTAASCQTGEANTAFLVGATGEPDYPFAAAAYCDGLSAHGYDDWYLPAQDELNVLYTNRTAGDLNGTFNETGSTYTGWYWSSSERGNIYAGIQRFSDGWQFNASKSLDLSVRCVRRD